MEDDAPALKNVEIDFEGRKYNCVIKVIKESLVISLDDPLKYKGSLDLSNIHKQISDFNGYNINEIMRNINLLDNGKFSLSKEHNKYKLKIKFIILSKEKYLIIDLEENSNINKAKDKQINQEKDNKINFELNSVLNNHTKFVECLTILKDGRMASGSSDNLIIIYQKNTFKPDLTIKEHTSGVTCLTTLSSGILASCSQDHTIKLFNINKNNYILLQTLFNHNDSVKSIIELENKQIVSCSFDKSLIVFFEENNEYKMDYKISIEGECYSVIQTKNNQICYSDEINGTCFFDITERKLIKTLNDIRDTKFFMLNENIMLIGGWNKISVIDINQYNLIRVIKGLDSFIARFCKLNETIITGEKSGTLKQWKLEGDNLILISKKEKAHNNYITSLLNLGDGYIASGSWDYQIKIWK